MAFGLGSGKGSANGLHGKRSQFDVPIASSHHCSCGAWIWGGLAYRSCEGFAIQQVAAKMVPRPAARQPSPGTIPQEKLVSCFLLITASARKRARYGLPSQRPSPSGPSTIPLPQQ
jgi:hypothetical protein